MNYASSSAGPAGIYMTDFAADVSFLARDWSIIWKMSSFTAKYADLRFLDSFVCVMADNPDIPFIWWPRHVSKRFMVWPKRVTDWQIQKNFLLLNFQR